MAYTKPQQRKKEESENPRGESGKLLASALFTLAYGLLEVYTGIDFPCRL